MNRRRKFETLFERKSSPETTERIGVMSVDSLNRQWALVVAEDGYLVATSKDGKAALLGRMCKRDDGKFCIEVVVRAQIERRELHHYEFWHGDPIDEQRHAQWLDEACAAAPDR
ncbi:hypothetical protein G3N64_07450 [Burkholderia sp. Ac-20344]|nr:hypothetical protein [Burkholderia sp. Ac-20344]